MPAASAGPIRVGVGGWLYEPWRGPFYPPGLRQADELAYAAARLTGLEINGTFYSRKTPQTFAKWRAAVPAGFRFTVKAGRACTHRKNLAQAGESVARFLAQGLTELGPTLGPIVWQLPATKAFDAAEIAAFLALLPAEQDGVPLRHAIEPRHVSFADPTFYELARQAGATVVFAHAPDYPCLDDQGGAFTYARLQCATAAEPAGYPPAELDAWAAQARRWAKGGREVFVFFISGAKERNPLAAMALMERLG